MWIEFHRNMLRDNVRNEAFHRALAHVIKPGESVVADVGSGTGFLGFLAERLGAQACHLYEYGEVTALSEKLARRNKIRRCFLIPEHSTAVIDPAPVDIVVSETLGNYALEENIIETMEDAKRFLKPGGVMIPGRIEQFVAPVTARKYYDELTIWDDVGFDLDFRDAKRMSLNNLYVRTFAPDELWQDGRDAACWDRVDFRRRNRGSRRGKAAWTMSRSTTIFGFAMWWTSELVPGVTLTTSPLANATHWEQLYFPVLEPISAKRGDRLSIAIRSDSGAEGGAQLRWTVTLITDDGKRNVRQALDMRRGLAPV